MAKYSPRSSASRTISVDVDIDIEEFDDEALVAEVVDRDLVTEVLKAAGMIADSEPKITFTPADVAREAQEDLLARRATHALAKIDKLIALLVPTQILAARQALIDGRTSAAICELDGFISPSLAAKIDDKEFAAWRKENRPPVPASAQETST